MADIISSVPLRPKWTDRQRIAAADLTAEQHWQDAQLMRLRRLALGWGVVAGLEVLADGDGIVIAPGYGITAAGSEVYLPDRFHWSDLPQRIAKFCGEGSSPCNELLERKPDEHRVLGAWLVLVPRLTESCPRPTLPDGCAHPGSAFVYSRQGVGLLPELRCNLPDRLLQLPPDCSQLNAFLKDTPVPMPDADDDILPLAWIACEDPRQVTIQMDRRRKLLSLSMLQDLIACCDCNGSPDTPEPEPKPEPDPKPEPGSVWDKPQSSLIGQLIEQIEDALPRGSEDFELTLTEIFAKDRVLPLLHRDVKAVTEMTRRFAASLLVHDEETLDYYLSGEYASLLKAVGLKDGQPRGGRSVLERLAQLTLAEIWKQDRHGYTLVLKVYSDKVGKELIQMDPADFMDQFDKEGFAGVAALDWLQNRLVGRWDE